MNTTPDEALLALWLDDELQGEELAKVEAWAFGQPDQLAAREEVRSWRRMMNTVVPAEIEPPYPDFFNSRIEQSIREQMAKNELSASFPVAAKVSFWKIFLFPTAAVAGMALAFWVGTKANSTKTGSSPIVADVKDAAAPVYYTPEQGVDAEWVRGSKGAATVIVLQGVNAIPDSLDFSGTVLNELPSSHGSTADANPLEKGPAGR